jgi:hypothetical protein
MLTLQIVPYSEIYSLSSVGRIRKLLNLAKEDKLILLQGRLRQEEEAELIKATMEEINKDFKGIELAVIDNMSGKTSGFDKLRNNFLNMMMGNRQGLTIIGPANIVKKIKKDPKNLQVIIEEEKKKSKRKKRKKRKK